MMQRKVINSFPFLFLYICKSLDIIMNIKLLQLKSAQNYYIKIHSATQIPQPNIGYIVTVLFLLLINSLLTSINAPHKIKENFQHFSIP